MNQKNPPEDNLDEEDQAFWDSFTEDMAEHESSDASEENFETLLDQQDSFVDEKIEKSKNKESQVEQKTRSSSSTQNIAQLDRRTDEKLRKGKMPIEACLDLHGMRQDEAYQALQRFVETAYQSGKRCILVITGKGKAKATSEDWLKPGQGVLKRLVPEWLSASPLNGLVLKKYTAQPQDGGSGALYVYLRRKR